MAFLRNKTVNRLNLHYALLRLAASGGGVFFGVYMLTAGVPAPTVLLAYALMLALRFCLRPLVLVVAKRVGLKATVIFGTLVLAVQYPALAQVDGVNWTLLAPVLAGALGDAFYWTSYHAYFAQAGDAEHRGHQTSAREAVAAVVGIVAPIAAGWALATLGPVVAFGAAAAVQALAVLPLLGAPDVAVARQVEGAFQASIPGFLLFLADGWIAAGNNIIWQIILFTQLRESFTAFGGAMALAALAAAALGLVLGRHIDAGRGGRVVWLSIAVVVASIVARALASSPALAVAANAGGALVSCLYVPTLMTATYNMSKRSPCPLRFQLLAEGGWDIGYATACVITAGLVTLGAPLQAGVWLTLIGAAAMLALLRRYYGRIGREAAA